MRIMKLPQIMNLLQFNKWAKILFISGHLLYKQVKIIFRFHAVLFLLFISLPIVFVKSYKQCSTAIIQSPPPPNKSRLRLQISINSSKRQRKRTPVDRNCKHAFVILYIQKESNPVYAMSVEKQTCHFWERWHISAKSV